MANKPEYKTFKYYEGVCSGSDLLPELAKVLSIGVRSKEIVDTDGNVVQPPFILQSKNWDIAYPVPDKSIDIDWNNPTSEDYKKKIENQIGKISDTIILKTTTTTVDISKENIDDLSVDADVNKANLTMYLEIYKPAYIADPETYPLDCERQGIIPRLKTKDLYEKSYSVENDVEETISLALNDCCKIDKTTSTYDGVVTLKNDVECSLYVSKIINIYGSTAGDDGFYAPIGSTVGTQTSKISFDNAKLARTKTKDNELYQLIIDSLAGGIDSKTYTQLSKVSFYITKNSTDYTLSISAEQDYTTYQISGKYKVKFAPNSKLVPEFFLDGVYTPLSDTAYEILDKNTVNFLETIKGEKKENGDLVIRYKTDNKSSTVTERKTVSNNHYVLMRLFDNINEELDGPADNMYAPNGEIISVGSHTSDWSKMSWYKDFEEIFVDSIDSDTGSNNMTDGVVKVPLQTDGLNAETKLRYFINTNNDRFTLILMGNPSLDYTTDRHLISSSYCGRIESFDNSINDTAGNFALFASSSTEPCDTKLNIEKVYYTLDIPEGTTSAAYKEFIATCFVTKCVADNRQYYITLPEGRFFDKNNWPKYSIADTSGKIVTEGFLTVHQISYASDTEAVISIHNTYDESHIMYIAYPYYEEKYVITSGVSRDKFGNVIATSKTNTYGKNTSDGITSIMMYHTRSKAYYQKHHPMFTTTEEYMSKIMYGKSAYTGEYYADKMKLTHGNDGPRGILEDLLVIDSQSLYPMDELVINKDFEKDPDKYEETYIFFPITAPFSPLSDSPNARYGFAIKKGEIEPTYTDEEIILKIAMEELQLLAKEAWWGIVDNIYPLSKTSNGCNVFWEVVKDSDWSEEESNHTGYVPLKMAIVATTEYAGDVTESGRIKPKLITLESTGDKATKTKSNVKVGAGTVFTLKEDEKLYYGISDKEVKFVGMNAQIKVHMTDASPNPEGFEYAINGVPYTKLETYATSITVGDILELIDADPTKYLVLYSIQENDETNKYFIHDFACVPLKGDSSINELLSYPCKVNSYITSGVGKLLTDSSTEIEYAGEYKVAVNPGTGWELSKIYVNGTSAIIVQVSVSGVEYPGCVITNVTEDTVIKIELALKES